MEQGLKFGEVYETILEKVERPIKKDYRKKTIYMERLPRKGIIYAYVIISRNRDKVEAFRFEKYELKEGTPNIPYAVKSNISELERKFIEERLKKARL